MSMNNLSIDGEFRYIVTWFNEWSELQRDDFVSILVDYILNDTNDGRIYMNGLEQSVANNMAINDRPMSLFQCRVKLFRQWTPKWPIEFKHKLKEKIIEIDPKVGEKIINEIKRHNEAHSNGNSNLEGVAVQDEIVTAAAAIVDEATEEAANVLLTVNETPATDGVADVVEPDHLQSDESPVDSLVVTQAVANNAEVPLVA